MKLTVSVNLEPSEIIEAKYFTIPFSQLLEKYPSLNSLLLSVNPPKFDLGDSNVLSQLNRYLFKEVVNLEITVPQKNLIPSLGIRYAYCEYIISLMKTNYPLIEVGTGVCAAISMILANVYKKNVLATEINSDSYYSALKNIKINQLSNLIDMYHSQGEILEGLIPKGRYSGLFCYPPIYTDDKTILAKKRGWKGIETELIGGGKKGMDFSKKLLKEALESQEIKLEIISLMLTNINQIRMLLKLFDRKLKHHFIQINAGTRKRYILVIEKDI